jgi:tetratricopeptide (TPR) repeat protein
MQGPARKPVWQPGRIALLPSFLKSCLQRLTVTRLALAVFLLPALFYLYDEVARTALIIDPITVPKDITEKGFTPEVMANRIGDALLKIETSTETRMQKENLRSLKDEGSMPDVEIPGTKFGVKEIVDITRRIFKIYPKHVTGDIVFPAKDQAIVTVYITQGRNRIASDTVQGAPNDLASLAQRTAEVVLRQVNPYVLAAYQEDRHEYGKAVEIIEGMLQDPLQDRRHKVAALNLWGHVLQQQQRYEDAIDKYQKAVDLDRKDALSYYNGGVALEALHRYPEAGAKFQKAVDLNSKDAVAYNSLGGALYEQQKYRDAADNFQKAAALDPKYADAYYNWGNALDQLQKYPCDFGATQDDCTAAEDAIDKYQKAVALNPKYAEVYRAWSKVLFKLQKYDDSIRKDEEYRRLSLK